MRPHRWSCPIVGFMIILASMAGAVKAFAAPIPTAELEAMIHELEVLTGWDLSGLPRPYAARLTVLEFEEATHMGRGVWGGYNLLTNELLLSDSCWNTMVVYDPKAHCKGVLLHELVHWVQDVRDHVEGFGFYEEQEATFWKQKYLAQLLHLDEEVFVKPKLPRPDELPPMSRPLRFFRSRFILVPVVQSHSKVWLNISTWLEDGVLVGARLWWHKGLLVKVELFETRDGHTSRLIETWWDAGYAQAGIFPSNPRYTGKWIKAPLTPSHERTTRRQKPEASPGSPPGQVVF